MARLLALPAFLLLGSTLPALAEEPPPEVARVEVLPGWRTEDGHQMAALRLTLQPGWKTYWRSPGAAGLAPILDFSGSTGVAGADPRWPVPRVFEFNGLRSIGYEDTVTIPVDVTLTGGPARLAGQVEIGVCSDICVPVRLGFSADLPDGGRRDPAIAAALVDQPMTGEEAKAHATCAVAPDSDGVALTVHLAMPPLGPDEAVVIESGNPDLWVSEPASERKGDLLVATAEAQSRDGGPLALDRSSLRITVLGEGKAVDIHGCQAG